MTNKAKISAVIAIVAVFGASYGVYHLIIKAPQNKGNVDVTSIKTFEQCSEASFPIIRHYPDQCQTPDGRIFINENPPSEAELAKAEQAIKTFMGDPNLELEYITQNRHPANFGIYKPADPNDPSNTDKQTAIRYDFTEEWDRPVYIFQQTEYINNRCEVYQYQVTIKTNQVVEIGMVYPEGLQAEASISGECGNGSLEWPLKTKEEIEQAAFAYLGRDSEHTGFLARSDIQLEYISSKPGAENPSHNEWRWEDKSYKLPKGLIADPFPYPTMRIIMSSGRKLVYYLNTTDLFNN